MFGTIVLPEPDHDEEDLRWFTLRADLESLSPQRSGGAGLVSASGAAASACAAHRMPPPPPAAPGRGSPLGKRPRKQQALKDEDPTRHEGQEPGTKLASERAKRQHRQHATNYRFRVFTDDEAQAAFAARPSDPPPLSAPAAPHSMRADVSRSECPSHVSPAV